MIQDRDGFFKFEGGEMDGDMDGDMMESQMMQEGDMMMEDMADMEMME